jgi:hypothetical protein
MGGYHINKRNAIMATRGNAGRGRGGGQGSCGGTPRRDGSGGGTGNRGTSKQPTKKSR